jgi:cephalosporin hydroxylase
MPTPADPKDPDAIARMAANPALVEAARRFMDHSFSHRYSYNFSWLGRPIIQYPQDILATQELIWKVKPDLIVETGIAHGGSLIFSASMLQLIGGDGLVVGIDVDIRPHNRVEIEAHPLAQRITMIQGSSIDPGVVEQVKRLVAGRQRVMVFLDSNHTHDHVLQELELYAPLVTTGSYLIVFDTVVEDLPAEMHSNRPWGPGNNPKTAVHQFLKTTDRFRIDREIQEKLLITVCPDGFLECIPTGAKTTG